MLIPGYLAMIGYGFYIAYLNGAKGQSPGKALMGLKVVAEADGQLIGGGMGIVRTLCHFFDGLLCGLGYLWPWDEEADLRRQDHQDRVLADQEKQAFGPDLFKP